MNFRIIPTNRFKKDVLELVKDYPRIWTDLKELTRIIKKNERTGTSLGSNISDLVILLNSKHINLINYSNLHKNWTFSL